MSLDLLVPGLRAPAPGDPPRLPHLERWLARASAERVPARGALAWIGAAYAVEAPPAVGPVSLAGDGHAAPGTWLRADPVHARVDRDAMVLHDGAVLEVQPAEAAALVDALRGLYAADGFEFRIGTAERWYVRVPDDELPDTVPLEEALGRDLFRRLPRGKGRVNWASVVTEVQMLFTTHAVNLEREARRAPAINAAWFWGGGQLPAQVPRRYGTVAASEPYAMGLAALSGARLVREPARAGDLDADAASATLVVLETADAARRRGDASAWSHALEALDAHWFAAVPALLARHREVRLVLPGEGDTLVATLRPSARWNIFSGRKPLSAYA